VKSGRECGTGGLKSSTVPCAVRESLKCRFFGIRQNVGASGRIIEDATERIGGAPPG
jgi:hypothetical protein